MKRCKVTYYTERRHYLSEKEVDACVVVTAHSIFVWANSVEEGVRTANNLNYVRVLNITKVEAEMVD